MGYIDNASYHFESPYLVIDRTDSSIYFDMNKLLGITVYEELNFVSLFF